jgi:hypothetical protein
MMSKSQEEVVSAIPKESGGTVLQLLISLAKKVAVVDDKKLGGVRLSVRWETIIK